MAGGGLISYHYGLGAPYGPVSVETFVGGVARNRAIGRIAHPAVENAVLAPSPRIIDCDAAAIAESDRATVNEDDIVDGIG